MSRSWLTLQLASRFWAVVLVMVASSCGGWFESSGQSSLGIMPGVVNDPGNRSLRRAILRFGLDEFCKELTHRGTPLKMRDDSPVTGRYYARTCNYQELSDGDVFVQFAGTGYAWTNVSLRIGFEAGGAIQYNQDFLMDGSTMYTYFRTRTVASKSFNTLMVERGGAQAVSAYANPIAQKVVETQLTRGFTVIRDKDGSVEFGVGVIEKGLRPIKPFEVKGDDRLTVVNERTEVAGQQLDFIGPIAVGDDDLALYLTSTVDGIPAVDLMVVSKSAGDPWVEQYVRNPGIPRPQLPPLTTDVVPMRTKWQKVLPVAKGHYYVVIDNSSSMGTVAPPRAGAVPLLPGMMAPPDPAAVVSIVVQVGEAP